jgi:hypothetical protein
MQVDLQKLNDRRLLKYYQKQRSILLKASNWICDCGWGLFLWNIYDTQFALNLKQTYLAHVSLLIEIKTELNERGHFPK